MSRHDARLPRERDGTAPLFAEAWQAGALAIANVLIERDVFSAAEWSVGLGAALRESQARNEPDDEEHYYEAVLATLQRLISRSLPEVDLAFAPRIEEWRRAYLKTPHGQPVELSAAGETE